MDKDTEFLTTAEAEMASLEAWLEELSDELDCTRTGNVLTIELDTGDQVVVNIQTPMHEIWCASRFGGYHFSLQQNVWKERRTGMTLETCIRDALRRFGANV